MYINSGVAMVGGNEEYLEEEASGDDDIMNVIRRPMVGRLPQLLLWF